MTSGSDGSGSAVAAAFRAALLHQALIVLVVFAVAALAWAVLRARRPGAAPVGGPVIRAEPAGRRLLVIGFGNLWLFDAFLQAQPRLALGLPGQVIGPAAASSPPWVQHLAGWAAAAWAAHPVQAATAAVWIEAGIGLWLLTARGALSRLAGLAAAGWGLVVWVFGEALGGIFAPGLSWLTGAPGAALAYVAAGALIALPGRGWRTPQTGRLILAGLGVFLAGMAVLQAWPGRGFWTGLFPAGPGALARPGSLAGAAQAMALVPQPGFLSAPAAAFAAFGEAHGFAVNLVAVAVPAVAGAGFLAGRPRLARPALAGFTAVALAVWVLVQDLGFLGGLGTDPGSMIPLILLAAGGYLALTRPGGPAGPPPTASGHSGAGSSSASRAAESSSARSAGTPAALTGALGEVEGLAVPRLRPRGVPPLPGEDPGLQEDAGPVGIVACPSPARRRRST
jgi:hypothetical protein